MGKKSKQESATEKEFVLDVSVTMVWAFEDETDPYAEAVADSLSHARVFVPSLWHLETANALLVGERRKRLTEAQVAQFMTVLQSFPITMDEETTLHAWQDTLHLARSHGLSVYDATYLELALRRGLPLASLDAQLKAAAGTAGVAEFVP
jgi:predicted nucleic acid-binding protein